MKFSGTIAEVRQSRDGFTLIVDTVMGLRGVEFERDLLDQMLDDFELTDSDELIGWAVEYNPAHGDLDITMPDEANPAVDNPDGIDDHDHTTE